MMQSDQVFAADFDLESKTKLTELQLKAHLQAQQRALLQSAVASGQAHAMSMEVSFASCSV
jgi:hypothetical protein